MTGQPNRELTPAERDQQENDIIVHFERMVRMQTPKTKLAQLRHDEAVAVRGELVARMDVHRAKGQLRQLALESDLITVEEASKLKQEPAQQEPKPGPDRN